jgi:t-SNARE complex subunit (syntaxin)
MLRESDAGSDKNMSDEVNHQCLLGFPNAENPKRPSSSKPSKPLGTASESVSFTATIRRLEGANRELTAELERGQIYSEDLLEERRQWEAKYRGIYEELDNNKSLVKQLQKDLNRAHMGIAKAMETLKNHQLPENKESCAQEDASILT